MSSSGEDPGQKDRESGIVSAASGSGPRRSPAAGRRKATKQSNPEEQADAEIDGREVAGKTGQQADEIEAGGDADAEAAAGKEAQRPTGSAAFQGGKKRKVSRMPMARETRREAMKRSDHGFASLR